MGYTSVVNGISQRDPATATRAGDVIKTIQIKETRVDDVEQAYRQYYPTN